MLHSVADRLNTVADHLPLPDQIRPDPGLSEILDDEVRHLARLLAHLVGEHSFRHRAATHYPARITATHRRTTLALARAAEPTGAALAALGAAVQHLGLLTYLTQQSPNPTRDRAITTAHEGLEDRFGETRSHLAHAAKLLRAVADTQPPPAATGPSPSAPATAPRTR
ncbi:hypothetical protein [Streptomyces scabiei]|uniref:hypothetical protein n=1 Tax=Streptomyces scabiei TaxID=1930 RepID=UPI0029BABE78|nr:hypothetical protein [Streptomyces scabiei]MDX3523281.1 hypothetical protein [Streptomyces scabiei]